MNKQLRILLAEDDYLVLMGLKADLEQLGHTIVGQANNGYDAVELAKELKPDLVISDINMPKLDGIEAIKEINEELVIPSIIVSAYYDEKLINRATNEGVLYYLLKPVDLKELEISIKISLSRFEEIKELQLNLQDTQQALKARKFIEKAKGILMDRNKLTEPKAMEHLQRLSRNNNKKIIDVAKEVISADDFFA